MFAGMCHTELLRVVSPAFFIAAVCMRQCKMGAACRKFRTVRQPWQLNMVGCHAVPLYDSCSGDFVMTENMSERGLRSSPITLDAQQGTTFKDRVADLLPEGGNLNMCLTCGACSAGCPATGLEDMDPRKFLRLASLGMDEEVTTTPWVWMCTMCMRCIYVCPMRINIPQLVYYARASWPREKRPQGIVSSCDLAIKTEGNSAMGASSEDFRFVVEDVLEEVHESQKGQESLLAPMDKYGAEYFLNQNSREPVLEPDEMVPLWKILNIAGCDWTYGSVGWAAENYCMFAADDKEWEQIVRNKVEAVEKLGCKYWLNTE